jgi:hypothetical protein
MNFSNPVLCRLLNVVVRHPLPLCLILSLVQAGGPACAGRIAVPVYAEHRAWLLACDNTRRCEVQDLGVAGRAAIRIICRIGGAPIVLTDDWPALFRTAH